MQYFARLKLRKHSKCNILLGWAFESTIAPHLFSFRISKYSKCYTLVGWAFGNAGGNDICSMATSETQENTVNTMLRSVEPSRSKWMAYFAGLGVSKTQPSLWKHNSATLIFPSESQNIVNAILCWAGSSRTKTEMIYARWRFLKHQKHTANTMLHSVEPSNSE